MNVKPCYDNDDVEKEVKEEEDDLRVDHDDDALRAETKENRM